MSKRLTQDEKTIFSATGLKTANFTAATTDIVTSASHGLVTGDRVVLTTTNTLPAGLSTGTVYFVRKINANTFYLLTANQESDDDRVDITDTGTGTHTWTMHDVGHIINVERYAHAIITVDTDGGGDANMTVRFRGAISDTAPDFSAAQSDSNRWDYIQLVDLEDGSTHDGDTGFSVSGADDHRIYEVNINNLKWFTAIITSHTEGEVTIKIRLAEE